MIIRHAPTFPRLPALPTLVDSRASQRVPATVSGLNSATSLQTRADFDSFALRDGVPGALGVRELKFVIADFDTDTPSLYFINANRHRLAL